MKRSILLFFFLVLGSAVLLGQRTSNNNLVQFSGVIMDSRNLQPIPYTNVYVVGKGRGTYSDEKGFFTIVAEIRDTIQFSFIGYRTVDVIIPDTLEDNRYSIVQLMTRDAINLPETVIFPWPSKEHFDIEFLAMDATTPLEEAAAKNLEEKALRQLMTAVPSDGDENADFYLRQQARTVYYQGQRPPMNIFNPLKWAEFVKAWKNGDFKRKRKN
ncbi:MAG: carboxypeptidase-like regulatory domain-containing protein [Bacteroidia bacterium]|nr:carboxypeptidase-like regulatory domain-containing protein [Bacteroidia bacterium]